MSWRASAAVGVCVLASTIPPSGCEKRPAEAGACEPYEGSPLLGRWVAPGRKRVLEFMADGTMVELRELEGRRSTRQPDGSFKEESVRAFECSFGTFHLLDGAPQDGLLECELTRVGGFGARKEALPWRLDPTGKTLALLAREAGLNPTTRAGGPAGPSGSEDSREGEETFLREDIPLSPRAALLVGLWRRIGDPTSGYVNMGVRFTPGGLAIVIGKNCPWDGRSGQGTIGWLCTFTMYDVEGGDTLREVRPGPDERSRSRTFRLEGNRLAFPGQGMAGQVYERVHGVVPLENGVLNVRAWNALD